MPWQQIDAKTLRSAIEFTLRCAKRHDALLIPLALSARHASRFLLFDERSPAAALFLPRRRRRPPPHQPGCSLVRAAPRDASIIRNKKMQICQPSCAPAPASSPTAACRGTRRGDSSHRIPRQRACAAHVASPATQRKAAPAAEAQSRRLSSSEGQVCMSSAREPRSPLAAARGDATRAIPPPPTPATTPPHPARPARPAPCSSERRRSK